MSLSDSPAEAICVSLIEQTAAACAAVRRQWSETPAAGIILGTGLGRLAGEIEIDAAIDYGAIPHFPQSTALAHCGRLLCGRLDEKPVVVMDGRCHLYEGYSFDSVTLGVRVMHALGAQLLLVSNAAGGLNPQLALGEIVVVEDHVNFMGLRGGGCVFTENAGDLGGAGGLTGATTRVDEPPVPPLADLAEGRARQTNNMDLSHRPRRQVASPYDPALAAAALAIAREQNFAARSGVYIAVAGPNYETRAEYRFFRRIGDVVGMSTAPEATVGAELGMRVLALSTVTNVARPDAPDVVEAAEVADAAEQAAPKVGAVFRGIVKDHCRLARIM